jgi:hypothetical protein
MLSGGGRAAPACTVRSALIVIDQASPLPLLRPEARLTDSLTQQGAFEEASVRSINGLPRNSRPMPGTSENGTGRTKAELPLWTGTSDVPLSERIAWRFADLSGFQCDKCASCDLSHFPTASGRVRPYYRGRRNGQRCVSLRRAQLKVSAFVWDRLLLDVRF